MLRIKRLQVWCGLGLSLWLMLAPNLQAQTGQRKAPAVSKTNPVAVYAHYMPWFEAPSASGQGQWGKHWTMAKRDPNQIGANGQREIASHYYPLIGPYSSGDVDVIDYHLLLMKYSGIDGVLVDWYGSHEVHDYGAIKRNTESLWSRLPATGLKLGMVYEDQTVPEVATHLSLSSTQVMAADFNYLSSKFFNSLWYLKINGRPLLMVYGPAKIKDAKIWREAAHTVQPQPLLMGLWGTSFGEGEYSWPDKGGLAKQARWEHKDRRQLEHYFSAVYPGFNDFYSQGGWPDCCDWTLPVGVSTLEASLQIVKTKQSQFVQLVTWNDFGEGTMLEPTREFGFDFLHRIQQLTGVSYGQAELELVHRWYVLRKKHATNAKLQKRLNQAYMHLLALRVSQAQKLLASMPQ
jgi:hypothetical protein